MPLHRIQGLRQAAKTPLPPHRRKRHRYHRLLMWCRDEVAPTHYLRILPTALKYFRKYSHRGEQASSRRGHPALHSCGNTWSRRTVPLPSRSLRNLHSPREPPQRVDAPDQLNKPNDTKKAPSSSPVPDPAWRWTQFEVKIAASNSVIEKIET